MPGTLQHCTSPTTTRQPLLLMTTYADASQSISEPTPDLTNSILSFTEKKVLTELIQKFPHVFTNKPGRTNNLQHRIDILPNTKPRNTPPYRYALTRCKLIEDNLAEMLAQGVITPLKSPWTSAVVLAPKKDDSLRFCIDYRKLNDVTVRDAYPISRIDDTLDALQHASYLSTLDLRSGYWQVEIDHTLNRVCHS